MWIKDILRKYGFHNHNDYVMKKGRCVAHIGGYGQGSTGNYIWATSIYVGEKSYGNFYNEEDLVKFLNRLNRSIKVKRILCLE